MTDELCTARQAARYGFVASRLSSRVRIKNVMQFSVHAVKWIHGDKHDDNRISKSDVCCEALMKCALEKHTQRLARYDEILDGEHGLEGRGPITSRLSQITKAYPRSLFWYGKTNE